MEVNQTLHDVWPSPGLVRYIYIFGALAPTGTLPAAKLTLRPNLTFFYIGSATTGHSSSGRQPNAALPPTFDRAAVTLGIGPHSSVVFFP